MPTENVQEMAYNACIKLKITDRNGAKKADHLRQLNAQCRNLSNFFSSSTVLVGPDRSFSFLI
jgi:hypothetical protein